MAIQALIRSGDTIKVSRSFGIVGSAVISGSKSPVIVVAANNNEPVTQQEMSINKPLVKMINALASIDGMIKQRLENQKIISDNQRLSQRESQVEQQQASPQIEVIQPDAERINGSNAGLFAVGGLLLLTLDPVQEAIKDLFDGVVSMGRFVTGVISSINGAFKFLVGDSASTSEASAEAPPAAPKEGGVVATPAPPVQEGTPPTPTPAPTQVTPTEKPSFFGNVASSAMTGAAIGSVIPRVGTAVGAAVGGAYGALSYTFGSSGASSSSSPAPVPAPAATGGATSTPALTPSPSAKSDTAQPVDGTAPAGNVISVNHPDTGPGYGIAGATDQQGRPVAFSKEGAEAFARMMADSGGVVKPSDVASSKRSPEKNASLPNAATNSLHLSGIAMDIHGQSNAWIKANGHKYGWVENAYSGSHGGHFEFKGPGMAPGPGSLISGSGITSAIGSVATASLDQIGKVLGAIGGAVVGPGIPRTDIGSIVSKAAKELNADVAASKTETPPSPPAPPTPPRINVTDSGAVQNPATGADRNSVYYYLRRFGFQDLSTPESALAPAA
jgi:hypothetical protein